MRRLSQVQLQAHPTPARASLHRLQWTAGSSRMRLLKLAPPVKAGARREAPDPSLPPPSLHPSPIASSTNLTLDPGSWLGLPSSGSGLSHRPGTCAMCRLGGGGEPVGRGPYSQVGEGSQGKRACQHPSTRAFLQEGCCLPPEPGHSQVRLNYPHHLSPAPAPTSGGPASAGPGCGTSRWPGAQPQPRPARRTGAALPPEPLALKWRQRNVSGGQTEAPHPRGRHHPRPSQWMDHPEAPELSKGPAEGLSCHQSQRRCPDQQRPP